MNRANSERKKLLIIEDDKGLQKQLKWSLSDYETLFADDRESALNLFQKHKPAVVTLDLGLPPDPANATEGLEILGLILSMGPITKIIVVTGNEERENALKAIEKGAYDFYQKPVEPEILRLIIDRGYQLHSLELENKKLLNEREKMPVQGIVTSSPAMLNVCETISKIAPTNVTVLLLGESGTGKELLARALHDMGQNREGPFIAINCAAIPENLLESELFGYEKGAFTGAVKTTRGKIEYANGGTLFLDEIGDLPQPLQAKLLRFVQERIIERVGGRDEIPINVRIVCATHQNLKENIKNGLFREDLYYRLSEISIDIPPLRERPEDAVLLAQYFLNSYREIGGSNKVQKFSEGALLAIENYKWPGNARELENMVKRAIVMAESYRIEATDMGFTQQEEIDALPLDLKTVRIRAEREAVKKALRSCHGKITQAAKILGCSRPTLYDLINRHGLEQ